MDAQYVLNLTQDPATPDQVIAGVVEVSPEIRLRVLELLNFVDIPSAKEVRLRAEELADLAVIECDDLTDHYPSGRVMIGGAPFLMYPLAHALVHSGLRPVFAFSKRVSVETANPDGSVTKTEVFKHEGFVGVF